MAKACLCLAVLLLAFSQSCHGYSMFRDRIPNGRQVPHPCKPNALWHGVGHKNVEGGGLRNAFGLDFEAAGKTWTEALCKKDSDGDARTNGQELGDPNCTWKVGGVPEMTTGLSHPGIADPFNDPKYTDKNSFVKCDEETLQCPSLNSPDVRSVEVRMPRVKVSPKATAYMCVNLPLPGDAEYHLVGMTPLIDNREVLHHAILFGCQSSAGITGVAGECGMGFEGCGEYVVLWSLGSPGYCFHSDIGYPFGKGGITRVMLQVHYTNPAHRTDYTDASGMKLYYTDVKRRYDGGTLMIGQNRLAIPPAQPAVSFNGTCPSACTQKWGQSIFVVDGLLHAHYLGTDLEVTYAKGGQGKMSLMREQPYSYDSPEFHKLGAPVEIRPGDEVALRCTYQSLNRKTLTRNGLSTYDEMCYAFLRYYPRNPRSNYCVQTGTEPVCRSESTGTSVKCDLALAKSVRTTLASVVAACKDGCSTSCADVMKGVMAHTCGLDPNFPMVLRSSRDPTFTAFADVLRDRKNCRISATQPGKPTTTTTTTKTATTTGKPSPATSSFKCDLAFAVSVRTIIASVVAACKAGCSTSCADVMKSVTSHPCSLDPAFPHVLRSSGDPTLTAFADVLEDRKNCRISATKPVKTTTTTTATTTGKPSPTTSDLKCDLAFAMSVRTTLASVVTACKAGCSTSCADVMRGVTSHPCSLDPAFPRVLSSSGDPTLTAFADVLRNRKECGSSTTKPAPATKPTEDPNQDKCTQEFFLTTTAGRQFLADLPLVCKTCTPQCKQVLVDINASPCTQEPTFSQLRAQLIANGGNLAKQFFETVENRKNC